MPNLTQIYANYCGIKLPIEVAAIPSNYLPVPEQYIVIHTDGDETEKKYSHYSIVLDLVIHPLLDKGIQVVQIGNPNDPLIKHALDFRGKSFRQNCFIIERSLMIVGDDSYFNYVAGYSKTPIVSLISADHAGVTRPHYIGEHIYIESHRNGKKPSYGLKEPANNKTIDLIKPEEVARSIFEILKLDIKVGLGTVRIGSDFYLNQIDFLCDYPIEPDVYNDRKIICRMDLNYNPAALAHCLYFYRAAVVTSKPIPANVLQKLRDKIDFIVILLEKGYSKGFIEQVHKSGIPYSLVTELTGKPLSDAKLDLFDFNMVQSKKKIETDFLKKDLMFRTNRVFLSSGKNYASAWHYKNGKQYLNVEDRVGEAINSDDWLDSLESYHLFEVLK